MNQSPKRWQRLAGILKESQSVHDTELKKELINATVGLVMHITPDPSRLNLNDFLNAASDTLSDAINNWDHPDVDMSDYSKHSSHTEKSFRIPSDEAVKEIGELAMKKAKADAFNRAVGDSLLELNTFEETEDLLSEAFRNFSLKKFKAIKDFDEQKDYVLKHLGDFKIGMGSARMVFPLGAGKVLKFGRMPGAYGQNKSEIKKYRQHGNKVFATIFDYDKNPEPVWIISEAVQIISEHKSLRERFSTPASFFDKFHYNAIKQKTIRDAFIETFKEYKGVDGYENAGKPNEFDIELLQKLFWVVKNTDLHDVDRLDHWGFTANGRIVLVDSGV